jgi:general L-amino acid transport system permease protein
MASDPRALGGRRPPSAGIRLSWNDPTVRALFFQALMIAIVGLCVWFLVHNTMANLARQKIASGFGFLWREAGLPIGDSPFIDYSPTRSYFTALLVGALNTLRVAVIGIVAATVLGTAIGIARLSKNWLLARCALVYVEGMRNVPLAVQLIFWWILFLKVLPAPRDDRSFFDLVFLTNSGIMYPSLIWHDSYWFAVAGLAAGIAVAWAIARWARARQEATGQTFPAFWAGLAAIVVAPVLANALFGEPLEFNYPERGRFRMTGGAAISPELMALLIGLITYTAAFIAEIVRSGILAVPWGQWEAAGSLGLARGRILRLVVLPQALRVIVPPMTSQYLNITKNSSLAVLIGYQDLVSIAGTTLNQTGQAVEGIAIIMAVFLTSSLFMNWYNRHIALVER